LYKYTYNRKAQVWSILSHGNSLNTSYRFRSSSLPTPSRPPSPLSSPLWLLFLCSYASFSTTLPPTPRLRAALRLAPSSMRLFLMSATPPPMERLRTALLPAPPPTRLFPTPATSPPTRILPTPATPPLRCGPVQRLTRCCRVPYRLLRCATGIGANMDSLTPHEVGL
jgi:hypothetical protein